MNQILSIKSYLTSTIWEADLTKFPKWKSLLFAVLRMCYVVIRDLAEGQLTLRAMSLVYTTLLSLVPLLAVSFSVLKAFGVHNKMESFLLNSLSAMGPEAEVITTRIIEIVENMKIGVLGALGLGLLFYTVVALIQKIESTFNYTWRIKLQRPLTRRFSDYLSVIVIGPVLIFSALGLTASIMSTTLMQQLSSAILIGPIIELITGIMPYMLIIVAFTFFYIFIPNTRVKFHAALTGAFVAGVLWQTTGLAFASFIVTSTKYTAVYSALATLILFMIWLYLAWLILLIGASISFYTQNPERMTINDQGTDLSIRLKEKLALLTMLLIGKHYYNNKPSWTLESLAHHFNIPADTLENVLQILEKNGLLKATADDPAVYLPAQPLDTTPLIEILNAIRTDMATTGMEIRLHPEEMMVEEITGQIDEALDTALQNRTIKDMVFSKLAI